MKTARGKSVQGLVPGITTEKQSACEEILERLKVAVKAANDSSLAESLGLGPSSVATARMRGMVPPSWIVNAANRYGLSADYLITGKKPDPPARSAPATTPAAAVPAGPSGSPGPATSQDAPGGIALPPSSEAGNVSSSVPASSGAELSPSAGKPPGEEAGPGLFGGGASGGGTSAADSSLGVSSPDASSADDSSLGDSSAGDRFSGALFGDSDEPPKGALSEPPKGASPEPPKGFGGGKGREPGGAAAGGSGGASVRDALTMREVADPESLGEDKFFALWEEFKGRSPASAGWTMMELIRRFPEFGEWLRKTR